MQAALCHMLFLAPIEPGDEDAGIDGFMPTENHQPSSDSNTSTLTHRTARGFAWMAGQSIAAKLITTVGQIILAWYLVREDFGLTAVTYMFSVVPVLIQQGGIKEVLIRRHRRFHLWANGAFWMSMALGLAGGAIMACIAPFAAAWYDEPRLLGLTLLIAILFPLDSLIIVPLASIYGSMRFRFAASLSLGQALMQTTLAVIFAMWGFGAFSLVLPRLFVAVASAIVCWSLSPVPLHARLQVKRWKLLARDGGMVIAANACELALAYGGYLILSVFCDLGEVGLFYFAFTLSLQTFALITQSLSGVLFPALNTLHDQPGRQTDAFLRAIRVLAIVMFPACFLQAALSDPGIRLLFDQKWIDAIPPLQALSVGMAMRGVGAPSVALFQAQNRFAARLAMSVVSVILFALVAGLGAWLDGAQGMAYGVAAHALLIEPFNLIVAIRHGGRGATQLAKAVLQPAAIGVLIIGPAWLLGLLIPEHPSLWPRLVVTVMAAGMLFFVSVRLLAPDVWVEGRNRLIALRR